MASVTYLDTDLSKITGHISHIMHLEVADDKEGQEGTFLDQSQTIWSQALGDPKTPSSDHEVHPYTDKLHGQYSWPFKLAIPRQATGKTPTGETSTYNLPATFSEGGAGVTVRYEMHVHIRRGKLHRDAV